MRKQPLKAAEYTAFVCALRACAKAKDLYRGTRVHADLLRRGLVESSFCVADALVSMYVTCGALVRATDLLVGLRVRNLFSWTALISAYARQGQGHDALNCFERMQHEGISPDTVTFACVLKACGSIGAADKGVQIHEDIARQGLLGNNIVLGTALVDMYAKCGALGKARQVLEDLPTRNVFSWTALITGYVQQGQGQDALNCFERMKHEGLFPDAVTFACILKACSIIKAAEKGARIHDEITRQGLLGSNSVLGTSLVDMYAKCGALGKARQVLEELPARDVFSWTALIEGYTEQGQGEEALKCFKQMQAECVSPNGVTFACVLKACGSIGAADKGEEIHDAVSRQGLLGKDVVLGAALVDMYVKCGALMKAQRVLEELPIQNVVAWTALIAGYAQQGQSQDALNCLEQMRQKGLSPNTFTFSCILNACSHAGLVDEGQMYFAYMSTKYSTKPTLEHYTCMVDLFGRAGHLDKAVEFIQKMPSSDCFVVWRALLGACRKWKDVNVGRWAFEHALQVGKGDVAIYDLMSNIYIAAGMQEDVETIEAMRMESNAWRS